MKNVIYYSISSLMKINIFFFYMIILHSKNIQNAPYIYKTYFVNSVNTPARIMPFLYTNKAHKTHILSNIIAYIFFLSRHAQRKVWM